MPKLSTALGLYLVDHLDHFNQETDMARRGSNAQATADPALRTQELESARELTSAPRVAVIQSDMQASGSAMHQQVAEAAYYLAEQRGFAPGSEEADWLAAEAQIKALLRPGNAPNWVATP
jgi:DUF2934 family protein